MTHDRQETGRELEPDRFLANVVGSIGAGGSETLYSPPFLPCGSETHEPFRLMDSPLWFPVWDGGDPDLARLCAAS